MKLCASRAFWLVAYPSQGHEMLFDAHTRCFAVLGGVAAARHLRQHEDGGRQGRQGQGPRRQRALRGDVRALPVRARLLQRRLGLGEGASSRRTCRTAAGASGIDAQPAALRLASPSSTPGWASAAGRCGSEIRHPEHGQFSVAEMLEHERPQLMPMPAPFDGYVEKPARVSQHLPGDGGAQPLLGAVRAGRPVVSMRLYPSASSWWPRTAIVAEPRAR